jgi:hypothetical protein
MTVNTRLCERCRTQIPQGRLEALPETRLCVKCSQAIGGDFVVSVVTENLGKSGSLKKNYGGVALRKTRRRIVPLEAPAEE